MDRGTYAAASAGMVQLRKLEVTNNNLANVNTPGFKKQIIVGQEQTFDQTFAKLVSGQDPYARGDHQRVSGTVNTKTVTDFSVGPIKDTGSPLDVALRNPNDFFVINTPTGQQYTRAGNFSLNAGGELVTSDGFQVVGDGGAITTSGPGVSISGDGSVRSNGQLIGKLQVARFADTSKLERVGSSRFSLGPADTKPATVEAELLPHSLEMPNINAISSVIDLITTNRAFELYTRSAQGIDQLNQAAISQVGKARG